MKKFYTLFGAFLVALSLNAQISNYTVTKIVGAPTIDGTVDAMWETIPAVDLMTENQTADATFNAASFKLAWNDTALFVLVQVSDDELLSTFYWGKNPAWDSWGCDGAQMYISGNASNSTINWGAQYSSDRSYPTFVPGGTKYSGTYGISNELPFGSDTTLSSSTDMIFNYQSTKINGNSYTTEFCMPWVNLKDSNEVVFPVAIDQLIRFDVNLIDVDNNDGYGNRRWLVWHSSGDWDSMLNSGVIKLGNITTGIESISKSPNIELFPNPTADMINLKNVSFDEVRILNVMGQEELHLKNLNNNSVNVAELTSGVYFISALNKNVIVGYNKFVKR